MLVNRSTRLERDRHAHALGNTRQAKKTQLPLVFNAIERYEKIWLCACAGVLSDVLKPTMSIDAPGTIRGTVEWSIPLEKSLYIPYSLKFSRVKIFEDFEDFCLASKILTLKILVLHRHLLKNLANLENFITKISF